MRPDQWDGQQVSLDAAIALLRAGEIVALPSETVYGLAADATRGPAIAKIYAAKNRPNFNPLICHVSDIGRAQALCQFDATAMCLAQAFWPGPLTLVLPRLDTCVVAPIASSGLDSLAVRVPRHAMMQAVLAEFPHGLVAPSANKSGSLSPVSAAHVWSSLGTEIPVLDGGLCEAGLESTIIACLPDTPVTILRDGAISREAVSAVLGQALSTSTQSNDAPRAPGQLLRHYAPRASLRLNATHVAPDEVLLGFGPNCAPKWNLSPNGDLTQAAANLFAMLHAMDAQGIASIAVSPIPDEGLGRAINDRLVRAARG